jgi:uncharacterized protein (TIGR03437 family)
LTIAAGPGVNQPPLITAIANGASYAAGPLSPGTLVTIFGTNLGPRNLARGTFANDRLTTNVGGFQVLFDGTPAPILYARFDQVSAAIPFEVSGKTQVAVRVSSANGQTATPFLQSISVTSPAIFTTTSTGTGQASVINQNGTINGAGAPSPKGSIVSIYMTGAGQLLPAGRSGALGAADQVVAAAVTVTIGGRNARVTYAGAAPGSVQGLYQINAVVPEDAPSGSVPIQLLAGETASQAGVTIFVQ